MKNHNNLFSLKAIIPHIVLIAIIIGVYYFLTSNDLFPQWIDYIYYGGKTAIALIFILGSARSGMMPVIALIAGLAVIFSSQMYGVILTSPADAWEILIMAFIGLIITILVKW